MQNRLTLMAGCVARVPFRTHVEAAARAGFEAITIWPNIWRHAVSKGGLSLRDMRKVLDDNGLALTDVEGVMQWPPGSEHLEVCAELGGERVVAMQLDPGPFDLPREAERFALFDEAAQAHGVKTAVEFVAFGGLRNASTAWRLIELAGSPEAGIVLDIAHHIRAQGTDAELNAIPAERIVTIQLADGPASPPDDLVQEATFGRMWPGEGVFDVSGFMGRLSQRGVRANVGLELYQPEFATRDPYALIEELARRTRACLEQQERE